MKWPVSLGLAFVLAMSVLGCTVPHAETKQRPREWNDTGVAMKTAMQRYDVTPQELAVALTTDPDDAAGERKTLRWEKRVLQIAVTRYSGTYARDVAAVLDDIEDTFGDFDRRILVCLREDDSVLFDEMAYRNGVASCRGRQADIELIFDATDRPKQGRRALAEPVPVSDSVIEDFWQDRMPFFNAQPTREACDFILSAGPGSDGIAGAAAIIRSRSQEVGQGHRRLCSGTLRYALLGAVPVRLQATDLSAAYTPALLNLLYSDEVVSGMTRDELSAVLTAAAMQ